VCVHPVSPLQLYAVPLRELLSNIPRYVHVLVLQLCVYTQCTKFSTIDGGCYYVIVYIYKTLKHTKGGEREGFPIIASKAEGTRVLASTRKVGNPCKFDTTHLRHRARIRRGNAHKGTLRHQSLCLGTVGASGASYILQRAQCHVLWPGY
jgi:hypothetical protein